MNPLTFTWYPSKHQHRRDESWRTLWSWGSLLAAALLLFCVNLDSLPLVESEQIFAQTAHRLIETLPMGFSDLYPSQPPLGLILMAIAGHWAGDHLWLIRLPGAILAAISVPLLYGLAREVFVGWLPAFLSALIYLTLFPVVCWGRLALLDGMVLFWSILTVFCVLRSRRDLRWSLGTGLSLSGLLLTHSFVGLLFCGLIIIFLVWDTPRLLSCFYFLGGILLGLLPALVWYWLQWFTHGQSFFEAIFWQLWPTEGRNFWALLGFYPVELLKYSWPWLIFAISGTQLIGRSLSWSWGKLITVWGGIYLGIICLLPLNEIHYLLPIYPSLALGSSKILTEARSLPRNRSYPQVWSLIFGLLSAALMLVNLSVFLNFPLDFSLLSYRLWLLLTLTVFSSTCGVTAILIAQRNFQFVSILLWGIYISLALFIGFSPFATP